MHALSRAPDVRVPDVTSQLLSNEECDPVPQPVLECVVQKGLVYNKVNPIFHHWRVDERKFGLTFQSPADAISFEKGLQGLIDKMDRGRARGGGDACISHAHTFINGSIGKKEREFTIVRTVPSAIFGSGSFSEPWVFNLGFWMCDPPF
jgi:hypothetical protein